MTVDKIEQATYKYVDNAPWIEIQLKEQWTPCLLGTSYCNKIVIWWDSNSSSHDEAIKIFAIEEMYQRESLL